MHQDRDESIRLFDARIRGQGNVCKYLLRCTNCKQDVNYTEQILNDDFYREIEEHDTYGNVPLH